MTRRIRSIGVHEAGVKVAGLAGLLFVVAGCHAATDVPSGEMKAAPGTSREAPSRQTPPAPSRETPSKESVRPPVQPAPAEARTPEEASKRAADPKDPSGALIVEPKGK